MRAHKSSAITKKRDIAEERYTVIVFWKHIDGGIYTHYPVKFATKMDLCQYHAHRISLRSLSLALFIFHRLLWICAIKYGVSVLAWVALFSIWIFRNMRVSMCALRFLLQFFFRFATFIRHRSMDYAGKYWFSIYISFKTVLVLLLLLFHIANLM